jgi:hypothetical protein
MRVGNVGGELKVAFVNYLHGTKQEMLECKVEKFLHDKDSSILP